MSSSRSFAGLNQSQSLSNRTKTPARAQVLRSPGLRPALAARTPLPSASKPRRSSRRSSSISLTPAVPLEPVQQPTQQQFATPAPKQKHWDEGDSLGSISEGLNELALGPALDEVVEEEEDGEPEYMPPRPERESPTSRAASLLVILKLTPAALPWEPLGAVPSVDEDMRVVMGLPPLWSMAIQPHDVPPMPELEPPSELNPDLCGGSERRGKATLADRVDDDELEEPMFRHLKKAELPLRMTRPPSVPVQTTNRPPIPASRMTRPPAPAPAPRSRVAHGPQAPTPSSRITKPPVPRLGARSTTPASRLTAGKVAPPAPENFDMGLLADDTPIMFDDLEFGFESSDDSDAPHTP